MCRVACAFALLIWFEIHFDAPSWSNTNHYTQHDVSSIYTYLITQFGVLMALSGTDLEPTTYAEVALTSIAYISGIGASTLIIGAMCSAMEESNATNACHHAKLEDVCARMEALAVPADLRAKCIRFYQFMFDRFRIPTTTDQPKAFSALLPADMARRARHSLVERILSRTATLHSLSRACAEAWPTTAGRKGDTRKCPG